MFARVSSAGRHRTSNTESKSGRETIAKLCCIAENRSSIHCLLPPSLQFYRFEKIAKILNYVCMVSTTMCLTGFCLYCGNMRSRRTNGMPHLVVRFHLAACALNDIQVSECEISATQKRRQRAQKYLRNDCVSNRFACLLIICENAQNNLSTEPVTYDAVRTDEMMNSHLRLTHAKV